MSFHHAGAWSSYLKQMSICDRSNVMQFEIQITTTITRATFPRVYNLFFFVKDLVSMPHG